MFDTANLKLDYESGSYCTRSMLKQFQADTKREQRYKNDGNKVKASQSGLNNQSAIPHLITMKAFIAAAVMCLVSNASTFP